MWIPRLFENGDYILPPRNASILKGCLRYKRSREFNSTGRKRLYVRLTRDLGVSSRSARILSSRNPEDIRRIEEMIEGIIDNLLLFDREMFITSNGYGLLKYLVKRILITSTYGTGLSTKYWKELGQYILFKASESEVLENPSITQGNYFAALLKWPKLSKIIEGLWDKRDLESLAHLLSSRNLPSGDLRALNKAIGVFRETVTSDYVPDDSILSELYKSAKVIGARCRKAGPGPLSHAHISMSTAGSLTSTVREGGRGNEIIENITPLLIHIPEEDESISTPVGTLFCPSGSPRWRHWCRETPFLDHPELGFGAESPETLGGVRFLKLGFDEAIGSQILACAYLDYKSWEALSGVDSFAIEARVLSIPEPGYKTRIVTTGPYWLNVLQQGIAHVTRGFLSSHPSAESGLERTDQAWQYLYLIKRAEIPEGSWALSSDLKEATDAIPRVVAEQLLKGFADGLDYVSPLYDLASKLIISDRRLITPENESFISKRGVLMGEPLTKTILTLLNLSCEEIAIRHYLNCDFTRPVQVSWRAFAVGGDDHIATGPYEYLREITRTHLRAGSKISPSKHSMSKKFLTYCEKLLEVRNFSGFKDVRSINNSLESYKQSPFIDSIKVRLLSRCSKSIEVSNDKNLAIGKGKSLGRTLRWLNPTHFPTKWVKMVRDRFFLRMGPFLPEKSSGVYWHLLLPEDLGGLGLWLNDDFQDLASNLPDPSRVMIDRFISDKISDDELELWKGFTSNSSYRGYTLRETETTMIKSIVKDMILPLTPSMKWKEAKLLVGDLTEELSNKQISSRLYRLGIYGLEDIYDIVTRPFLFKEILSGEVKESVYNTVPFKKRYASLWDLLYSGSVCITAEQVKAALTHRVNNSLYDLREKSPIYANGQIREGTIIDECTIGLPHLKIQWKEIGVIV